MILQHNPLDEYKWLSVHLRGTHLTCFHGLHYYELPWQLYFDNHIVAICHDCETVYYTGDIC